MRGGGKRGEGKRGRGKEGVEVRWGLFICVFVFLSGCAPRGEEKLKLRS